MKAANNTNESEGGEESDMEKLKQVIFLFHHPSLCPNEAYS